MAILVALSSLFSLSFSTFVCSHCQRVSKSTLSALRFSHCTLLIKCSTTGRRQWALVVVVVAVASGDSDKSFCRMAQPPPVCNHYNYHQQANTDRHTALHCNAYHNQPFSHLQHIPSSPPLTVFHSWLERTGQAVVWQCLVPTTTTTITRDTLRSLR